MAQVLEYLLNKHEALSSKHIYICTHTHTYTYMCTGYTGDIDR
jgi:hypothetical protein